ncbi:MULTISPECIES: cupin domain-containing protein [Cupriavidus]|nr:MULTISPECIES: cupin domain-containing protein [Cupriavidus]MDT6963651.1 cupin domain-containing protein [Cupriavidus sp. SZY C1]
MLDTPAAPPRQHPQAGVFGNIGNLPDQPCPIEPDWIRTGAPVTRCRDHSSTQDGSAWTTMWDCTRSTFEWHYQFDEVVVILEGSVRVTDSQGQSRVLAEGDVAFFPYGSSWLWEVDRYVRKVAFCHSPVPRGLRLPVRIARRLARKPGTRHGLLARIGQRLSMTLRRLGALGRTTATVLLCCLPL